MGIGRKEVRKEKREINKEIIIKKVQDRGETNHWVRLVNFINDYYRVLVPKIQ